MRSINKTLRICPEGHRYYKSTACPTCPVCEKERKPRNSFLSLLAAPAKRALENKGFMTLQLLSKFSEEDVLKFHGMGKTSIPKLKRALSDEGLSFKTK